MRRRRRDQQHAVDDLEADAVALQLSPGRVQIGDGQPRRAKPHKTVGGQTRQPTGDLGRAEHDDPVAWLSDRQPPGRKFGSSFCDALEEVLVRRRFRPDITTSTTRKAPLGWRW